MAAGTWAVCPSCGAVIADNDKHAAWHAAHEGSSDGGERTQAHGSGGE